MTNVRKIQERLNEIRDDLLLRWLQDQTDYPVVFADHSDPRPDGPHIVFKLLTGLIKDGGLDEKVQELSSGVPTGKVTLRGHRNFTIAIEAVGKAVGPDDDFDDFVRATDILQTVHLSLDLDSVRSRFNAYDIAIISEGGVTDISQILETETEPRALLEIVLRGRFDLTDEPGYFNATQMSGDFDTDCDGNTDISTGTFDS